MGAMIEKTDAIHAVFVLFGSLLLSACSLKQIALDQVSDSIASGGSTFSSDNDIELVGDATPFSLKFIESLLSQNPEHRGLLLASARSFTQYSYAYVQMYADEIEQSDIAKAYAERERARNLYLRARDYGLKGLSLGKPDLPELLRKDPTAAVSDFKQDDVDLLYWTGTAWAAAISLSKDDPFLIADLPSVEALMRRAYELDETFGNGSLHVFFISYEMSRKSVNPDAISRARQHFKKAIEISNGQLAAPYVALAESVCIPLQDSNEFRTLLNTALEIDTNEKNNFRLANLVMQKRAKWLLNKSDELFTE